MSDKPKSHSVLETLPRFQRRMLLETEARRRKSGIWPAWEKIDLPTGLPGASGWCRDVRAAYKNGVFSVLIRPLPNGNVHLAITSLSQARPTWWEAQRIKNELCGELSTAVEVYPPQPEVVDEADMYHLWTVDPLPFSIAYKRSLELTTPEPQP